MIDLKLCGMAIIFGVSAWTGFGAAAKVRRTVRQLDEIKLSLEIMRCEISYQLTPIRKMCTILANACHGEVSRFYRLLEEELLRGENVTDAAAAAKANCRGLSLPKSTEQTLHSLFSSFGTSDYDGQLRMIELAASQTEALRQQLEEEKANRCRSYELLGVCTGLALVILVA